VNQAQPEADARNQIQMMGQRNNTLTSLAGTMRRRGMGAEEIEAALFVTNNKRCDPPLPEDEVMTIVASVCRYKPASEMTFG
jgi:putative DNA primase/helicase